MARSSVTQARSRDLRDRVEHSLERVVSRSVRSLLRDVERVAVDAVLAGHVLTAAATTAPSPEPEPMPPGLPLLGDTAGRWASEVDAVILAAIREAFAEVFSEYAPGLSVTSVATDAMESYISSVRDRLVRGTYAGVTVYEESFDAVRVAVAQSTAEGWDRKQLAARIAAELSWDGDSAYWNAQKQSAAGAIDAILDPLGPPGTPAREYARLHDPRVNALRATMNQATKHLDAEQSVWQTRATLIARTESTGAAGYGALSALAAEGATNKMWLSARDSRTRASHVAAAKQVVPLAAAFTVGGYALQYPGDAAAPVQETANCRCTIISADIGL